MPIPTLETELRDYAESFAAFQAVHQLPAEWFTAPDHFAVKCTGREDYEHMCQELASVADNDGIWAIDLDGRSLASAQLSSAIVLAGHVFKWVEIMQPRLGKEPAKRFVEHVEFVFPDFVTICAVLDEKGIAYEHQDNKDEAGVGHAWVNLVIDSAEREIKLNDNPLSAVTVSEKAHDKLYKVEV